MMFQSRQSRPVGKAPRALHAWSEEWEESIAKGHRELVGKIEIFHILIVVVVIQVCICQNS